MKRRAVQVKLMRRGDTPCLLAAFNAGSPPLIWQSDLDKIANHTISLRDKEGAWDLGLISGEGTFNAIAHFDERREAEEAYNALQDALVAGEAGGVKTGVRWALIVIVLFGFFGLVSNLVRYVTAPSGSASSQTSYEAEPQSAASSFSAPDREPERQAPPPSSIGPKEIQTGVPMTADDVLTPPMND